MNEENNKKISFTYNSKLISATPGMALGAAILQSGERILRRTRFGDKPRGMFCGIGNCFDCLVIINGLPNQRACLTEVSKGLEVEIQIGAGTLALPQIIEDVK